MLLQCLYGQIKQTIPLVGKINDAVHWIQIIRSWAHTLYLLVLCSFESLIFFLYTVLARRCVTNIWRKTEDHAKTTFQG